MALVVPNHGLFLHWTPLHDVFSGVFDAVSTDGSGDVSTAKEEAMDGGGGVLASGGVVEFKGGVGGKEREEVVEIRVVDAVGSESGGVCAVVVEVCRSSCSFSFSPETEKKTEEE